MVIDGNTIIEIGKIIGALGVIAGVVIAVIKWFQKQEKQTSDIAELRETHTSDIGLIQDELCVLTFGVLATLDGLKQQGCNGNVTKAYEMLEKHLNKKAHDKK